MPYTFHDRTKATWSFELTYGDVLRVRQASKGKFELLDPDSLIDGRKLSAIVQCERPADYDQLWELLFLLVEPDADKRGVDAVAFGQRMAAAELVAAKFVFLEAWRDFFHDLQRPDLAFALEKIITLQKLALQAMRDKIANSAEMAALDDRTQRVMQKQLTESYGNLLADLDAILGDSPGDS